MKEERGYIKFLELTPFIFHMKDSTFNLWWQVYERARVGDLIAFNSALMKDCIPKKDRNSWQITKTCIRDLQGCDDSDLKKMALFLLEKKKISL